VPDTEACRVPRLRPAQRRESLVGNGT
jgi:hypothetical protein